MWFKAGLFSGPNVCSHALPCIRMNSAWNSQQISSQQVQECLRCQHSIQINSMKRLQLQQRYSCPKSRATSTIANIFNEIVLIITFFWPSMILHCRIRLLYKILLVWYWISFISHKFFWPYSASPDPISKNLLDHVAIPDGNKNFDLFFF